jgi:hypothetical protein
LADNKIGVHRRNFLQAMAVGGAAVAVPLSPAVADTENNTEKRKARYQPNSAEVQTFYRVNRYPGK